MTAGMSVTMIRTYRKGRVEAGPQNRKTGKQDRSRRHGRAAKPLSAHRFARHGRAGGECHHSPQVTGSEGIFACRVRHAALRCEWCLR